MASQKTAYSATLNGSLNTDTRTISRFVWKSIGAALCGAAIPAVVFYFLF